MKRVLYTAIVRDVFSNPSEILASNPDYLTDISSLVENAQFVERMPRNTILADIVTNKIGHAKNPSLFYPFFPPHFQPPIKVGEQIWVIFEDGKIGTLGYWISRKVFDRTVDDPNFTCGTRNQIPTKNQIDTVESFKGTSYDTSKYLHGGGPDIKNAIARIIGDGTDLFQSFFDGTHSENIDEALGKTEFTFESVPRFTRRPGDLVLLGSNNQRIVLGEDRPGGYDNDGSYNTNDNTITGAGTIDMVVGAGQEDGANTKPVATLDTTQGQEADKNPEVSGGGSADNPNEGDPDFETDLSRIYVSMKTNGDKNFDLEFTNAAAPQVDEAPYVIAKSTEVRLVGRDGGSVRLVKEGDAQAEICLMSDGTIVIEGTNSARDAQKVIRGEDLAGAADEFASAIATAIVATLGNMGGPVVDGGIASACSTFAGAIRESLSEEVFIK